MDIKQCAYCGFNAEPTAEFCVRCGRELGQQAQASSRARTNESQLYSIGPFTDIGAVVGPTLKIFTQNFWMISKLVFVIFAPLEILKTLSLEPENITWQSNVGTILLGLLCNALIAPSLIYALVTLMRTGVAPSLHESYRWGLNRLVPCSICALIAGLLVGLGTLLFIVPGIILLVGFELIYPMATLENGSPVEILKRSFETTKGYRWNIFWSILVLLLLCLAVSFPVNALSTVLIAEGISFWPLIALLAVIVDIINQSGTVLALVIYLSIMSAAINRQNSYNTGNTYDR